MSVGEAVSLALISKCPGANINVCIFKSSCILLHSVGVFPTVAMMGTSTILYYVSVPPMVEACLQNFAGGLILAAGAFFLYLLKVFVLLVD